MNIQDRIERQYGDREFDIPDSWAGHRIRVVGEFGVDPAYYLFKRINQDGSAEVAETGYPAGAQLMDVRGIYHGELYGQWVRMPVKLRWSQWLYVGLGLWWALMAMPTFAVVIAFAVASDRAEDPVQEILNPFNWAFPILFAAVGAAFCAAMVLLVWVSDRRPGYGLVLSMVMTGAAVGRHQQLLYEESERAWQGMDEASYWRQFDDRREAQWVASASYPQPPQQSYPTFPQPPPALQLSDPFSPPPNWNQATFNPFHGQMTHNCTPACPRYQWS